MLFSTNIDILFPSCLGLINLMVYYIQSPLRHGLFNNHYCPIYITLRPSVIKSIVLDSNFLSVKSVCIICCFQQKLTFCFPLCLGPINLMIYHILSPLKHGLFNNHYCPIYATLRSYVIIPNILSMLLMIIFFKPI